MICIQGGSVAVDISSSTPWIISRKISVKMRVLLRNCAASSKKESPLVLPSSMGLGLNQPNESVSAIDSVEVESVTLNESLGHLSESFYEKVADDSFIEKVANDLNASHVSFSDINVSELDENPSNVRGQRKSVSEVDANISNVRGKRNRNERNYSEIDGTVELYDSDDDKDYVPESKKTKLNEIKVQEFPPLKKRPGRRPGSKNVKNGFKSKKQVLYGNKKEKVYVSRPKNNNKKSITLSALNTGIDDGENLLKSDKKTGAENLDMNGGNSNSDADNVVNSDSEELDNSVIVGASGLVSPIKKKSPKKSRKRQRNENTWFRNEQKRLKNSGQPYQVKKNNKLVTVPAKKVGEPCKCLLKCFEKFSPETILEIFKNYWALGSYNKQSLHLCMLIDRSETKNEAKLGQENKSRVHKKNAYHIIYNEQKIRVCKEAFISIHGITKDRIQHHNKKRTATGSVILDRRGKNTFYKKVSDEQKALVHAFIQMIPARRSHYSFTHNPHKQYVDTEDKKSQVWFYRKYQEWIYQNHTGEAPVTESMFKNIYNNCYNLEIVSPRVDVCDTCMILEAEIKRCKDLQKDPSEFEEQYAAHKDKANIAYSHLKMAEDKEKWSDKDWLVICMDLQQTLTLPKVAAGTNYYLRKLNVYNFCIFEQLTKDCFFYVWEEFSGRKGSAEIYSCVYKYLNDKVFHDKHGNPVPKDKRPHKLRIIADNCGGQNKNNKLALALLRLVHLDEFKRIELAFLVPGHTYMPCDRTFGNISRELKKHSMIGSPENLVDFIKASQKNKGNVFKMKREEFVDVDVLTKKKKDRVCLIRSVGNTFQTSSVIVMRQTYTDGYILKDSFDQRDENGTFIDVRLPDDRVANEKLNFGSITFKPKYAQQIKLKKKKLEDLEKAIPILQESGNWITTLVEDQKQAVDYKEDDDDKVLFATVLGVDHEEPIPKTNTQNKSVKKTKNTKKTNTKK